MEHSNFEMRRLAGGMQFSDQAAQLHAYRRDHAKIPVLQAKLVIASYAGPYSGIALWCSIGNSKLGDRNWQITSCQNRSPSRML